MMLRWTRQLKVINVDRQEQSKSRIESQIDLTIRENNSNLENRSASLETMLVNNPPANREETNP